MTTERRNLERKKFTYHMRVFDELTGKLIGQLVDISEGGFMVESAQPIPVDVNIKLRIDQLGELSNKNYLIFIARAKWCRRDPYDPTMFNINVGFQIVEMTPGDYDTFVQMYNKYAMKKNESQKNNLDYLWR